MSSLQVLSNTEIRHEENCRAIPEGNEDEDEDEDDSIEKIITSLSESSLAPTEIDDSDSNSEESNSDTENGNRQTESKQRRRHVFHRVKRFVAGRKSVRC